MSIVVTACAGVVEEVVQAVFSTMLQMDVERMEVDQEFGQNYLLSSIQIAGGWMGSVVLSMSPEVSSAAASAMLQIEAGEVTDEDQQDVAGELVNMIGGNIKSLLPGPSLLSLPTVIAGENAGFRVHGAELIDNVLFISSAGQFQVRLFESTRTIS